MKNLILARAELRGFLGVLLILACAGAKAEQKLRADWVETSRLDEQTQRNYRGGIAFEDARRGLVVQADSAHVRVGDATYFFFYKVSYKDTVRDIRADTLAFYDREGRAIFRGRVFFCDGQRTLEARVVRFFSEEETLTAEGDVVLHLPQNRRLMASALRYDLNRDRGSLQGDAQLEAVGDKGDTLAARSDSMAFAHRGEDLFFNGNLILRQGRARGKAMSGAYADSSIALSGNPLVTWADPDGRDSISARGTAVRLEVSGHAIGALAFFDGARIHATAVTDSTHRSQLIRADSARIVLRDEVPRRVHAWGNVNLDMRDRERAVLSGSDLRLAYRDGKPDSLILSGGCGGSYVAADSLSESHLGGERCLLWFADGQLSQMAIAGQAHCTRVAQQGDHVTVSGDDLRLSFDAGHLSFVRAAGAVQGHYAPVPESEAVP